MFQSLPIEPALRPLVHDIRIQAVGPASAAPDPYMVLPGPFPVMGIRVSGELRAVRGSGAQLLAPSGITGLQDEPQWYLTATGTRSVLVAFRPAGVFGLFGVAMDELTNGELALDNLLPAASVRAAEDDVARAGDCASAGAAVAALLKQVADRSRVLVHPAVVNSLARISAQQGNVRIDDMARAASISRRQLERLFLMQVGMTPKRYAALVRFAWVAGRLGHRRRWSELALSAGYADQAHFIRAIRQLAGSPPSQLLADIERGVVSQSFNT